MFECWLKFYFSTYPCHLPIAYSLLEHFNYNPEPILALSYEELLSLNVPRTYATQLALPFSHPIQSSLEWLRQKDHYFVPFYDPNYPQALKQIHSPPLGLFVMGDIRLLSEPQLSIVGSRKASLNGLKHSFAFAKALSEAGLIITSGLALGIDAAAHQGALENAYPTIAVLGTGVDRVYPKQHENLYHAILERGAILSEFPLGTLPKPENFPLRNRIISGLSLGCLIIEASDRSGSLITARYALEQNREVFALPGSINNPNSKGCNQLIRSGALLVEQPQDILNELGFAFSPEVSCTEKINGLTAVQKEILQSLTDTPVSLDSLKSYFSLDEASLMVELIQLEMGKKIAYTAGGYIRLF